MHFLSASAFFRNQAACHFPKSALQIFSNTGKRSLKSLNRLNLQTLFDRLAVPLIDGILFAKRRNSFCGLAFCNLLRK
jgi:hypothetical protein